MCSLNATAVFPVSTLTHMFGEGSILKKCNEHITAGSAVYKQMSPETPPRKYNLQTCSVNPGQESSNDSYSRLYSERLVCQKFDS